MEINGEYSKPIVHEPMLLEEETKNQKNTNKKKSSLSSLNPNDALKVFSTFITKKIKKEKSQIEFPKFKYYQDITKKILKNKKFPERLGYFVNFVNEEIRIYKDKTEKCQKGLFATLIKRGFDSKAINKILQTWNCLVLINNHTPKCEKCRNFFVENVKKCELIDCNELDFIERPDKINKTEYSDWINEISQNQCKGFDPDDYFSFEITPHNRGKTGKDKGKRVS